jgi:hypothetical protein
MSGKPTISTARIRRNIRVALNISPGTGKTEGMLLEMVNELVGGGVSLQELRNGMEYNHGETYIRNHYDKEADVTEWFITKLGIQQENIK